MHIDYRSRNACTAPINGERGTDTPRDLSQSKGLLRREWLWGGTGPLRDWFSILLSRHLRCESTLSAGVRVGVQLTWPGLVWLWTTVPAPRQEMDP